MLKIKYIYLLVFFVATVVVYVIVFGSVGLLVQGQLQDQLLELEDDVGSLKKENSILDERYIQLLETQKKKTVALKKETIIILKFRKPSIITTGTKEGYQEDPLDLVEARILYLSAMFFMGLLGYVALEKWV